MVISLSRPDIHTADIDAVVSVLQSTHLSLGPALSRFEQEFSEYLGGVEAVAVSSGTAALHLSLLGLDIRPGDEVITTPFSFVASANVILMVGATPVFADIDPDTWNIGPAAVNDAVTSRTRAVLPVHVFGQPAAMPELQTIADRHHLRVVEDACEALGARIGQHKAGTVGDVATFAFYPNKQITTGEGGMLVTRCAELAALARSLRNQGRDGSGWLQHARMGYNYRMPDILCALGSAQLRRIDDLLARRARVATWYRDRLHSDSRFRFQAVNDAEISWFVMVVRLNDNYTRANRDDVLEGLRLQGIGCSNYFTPIHLQPHFVECGGYRPGSFPECERLSERTVALPFHAALTEAEVDQVCAALQALL